MAVNSSVLCPVYPLSIEEGTLIGDAERHHVMLKKDGLQSVLSLILSRNGAKEVKDLVVLDKISGGINDGNAVFGTLD